MMHPCHVRSVHSLVLSIVLLGLLAAGAAAQEIPGVRIENRGVDEAELGRAFEALDPSRIPTGLLIDQVAVLVDPSRYDGNPRAPAVTLDEWRQIYHQLSRSGFGDGAAPHPRGGRTVPGLPPIEHVNRTAERYLRRGLVPVAVLSVPFARIAPGAIDRGSLVVQNGRLDERAAAGPLYTAHRAFAAAAFDTRAAAGIVRFVIPPDLHFSRGRARPGRYSVDFGDGRGNRTVRPGEIVPVVYDEGGSKQITITADDGGQAYTAATILEVSAAAIPSPDLAWTDQKARRSYAGGFAGYDAYFFYGAGNAAPTRPVVFVEGFDPYYSDPAKRRTWEDIYELLLQKDFVNRLRALGYDTVIMKLDNATNYVQRNAFALEHLLGRLARTIPESQQVIVVGPSMGGLIGRFALAYMEQHGVSHNVRLFASLDAPQQAANFPLGVQFFLEFNDGDSELAAQGKAAVNSVAARQILAYQYRAFPHEDPLRTQLLEELTAYGYPTTRNIAIANGSGAGRSQRGNERVGNREMVPGDKIVEYRYRSWFVDLDGDVWAVPDRTPETRIFEGLKNLIGPHYRGQDVYVSGTLPYDNTPGGSQDTQREIADSDAAYGDIKTAFPYHSWIPTVSALDLATPDLAYDVAVDAAGLTRTTTTGKRSSAHFDAIFFPEDNEPHVFATEDNVNFLLDEIDSYFPASRTIAGDRVFNSGQHIIVADGVTLKFDGDVSIAPGVRFSLGRNAALTFSGRVTARGTAAAPITFERSGVAAWNRLDLNADGNLFEHVVLDGGTKTVEMRSQDNTFRYCAFRNGWRGISSNSNGSGGRSSFTLEHSTVEGNSSVGVVAYHAEARFEYVTIRDNAQAGVWAYDAAIPVFYRSVVTSNALTQTWRSGIEILGGSYLGLVGPDDGPGYTRVAENTSHEVYVSSSAGGAILGYQGYGGFNAIVDANEGNAGPTELLLRSTHSETIYADETYWGGFVPDDDDISGSIYLGTVLFDDPTVSSEIPGASLLALNADAPLRDVQNDAPFPLTQTDAPSPQPQSDAHSPHVQTDARSSGTQGNVIGQHGDLRRRMVRIRRMLEQEPNSEQNAALLRELFMLQRLDHEDHLGEKSANRAVFAAWRARLGTATQPGARAATSVRRAGEIAAMLEIRSVLFEERYDEASALIEDAEQHVQDADNRRMLLLEKVTLLEHEGRFADALTVLTEATDAAPGDDPPELYAIIRETLHEQMAEEDGASPQVTALRVSEPAEEAAAPTAEFTLDVAHPNPFNPVTTVPFRLDREADIRIDVYDVLGRRVAVLADGRYDAGVHRVRFDAAPLPSGLYFVRALVESAGDRPLALTQKVTLLK